MKLETSNLRLHTSKGFTIAEQLVAAAILAVATLGTLQYQYFAAGQGRIAQARVAAARVAQLLLEDWKSTGGSAEYDPAQLDLGFSADTTVPSDFTTPSGLGATLNDAVYHITLNEVPALILLKYVDVEQDSQARTTLRQIAVVIRFGQVAAGGAIAVESRFADLPPIIFATYVRLDATNG